MDEGRHSRKDGDQLLSYSSTEYQIEAHLYQLGTNPLVQHTS